MAESHLYCLCLQLRAWELRIAICGRSPRGRRKGGKEEGESESAGGVR